MQSKQTRHREALALVNSFDFDCMDLSKVVGRPNVFPLVVYTIIQQLPRTKKVSTAEINFDKLISFCTAISRGYNAEVTYHNELHGADVAQMMFMFIKDCNLTETAQLKYLDLVSAITAGACHDFDHDGFNNTYHVNFMTSRALRYHDKAVQENWHAS